jgi:hypothetical protein
MNEESKKINITGTNNRHMVKKLIKDRQEEKEIKKRVVTEKWKFSNDNLSFENQLRIIYDISNNVLSNVLNNYDLNNTNIVTKTTIQEINRKIYSYKQQDILKKHYDEDKFLTFHSIILKMIECELKCRYCNTVMNVLYDISREMKQWSVDRVDNDQGHNVDNYHLACLECNLKRRRRTDEKFLFTKQLKIVKHDGINVENVVNEENKETN